MSTATNSPSGFEAVLRPLIVDIVRSEVARALGEGKQGDPYLSTSEAAAFAGIAQGTVRRWLREGRLVAHRAGRSLRVRRDDLERLLRTPTRSQRDHEAPEALARRLYG